MPKLVSAGRLVIRFGLILPNCQPDHSHTDHWWTFTTNVQGDKGHGGQTFDPHGLFSMYHHIHLSDSLYICTYYVTRLWQSVYINTIQCYYPLIYISLCWSDCCHLSTFLKSGFCHLGYKCSHVFSSFWPRFWETRNIRYSDKWNDDVFCFYRLDYYVWKKDVYVVCRNYTLFFCQPILLVVLWLKCLKGKTVIKVGTISVSFI